ncbi:hypothetical protein CJI50_00125 [Bifidobacteriaceae bacterium NR021]|nr:hypothetical protein CJI50_00125 [Bifidobacteriaceae bacterium NR021]
MSVLGHPCSRRSARVSHFACFETLVQLALARITRSLAKLALEVHWTSNLSEFPLRVAFARAVLRSSRSERTFGAAANYTSTRLSRCTTGCAY